MKNSLYSPSEQSSAYDVCIVGAGISGAALARELTRFKLRVLVLEAETDVAMGSSKANSAIVHGGYAEAHAKLKGRVCYQGRRQFAKLDSELHFGFRAIGSFVLAFEESEREKLVGLYENGLLNGLPDLEILERDQILALEPSVNPEVKYALYCKGAGICSPYEMVIALLENAVSNGAEVRVRSGVCGATWLENEKCWELETTRGNHIRTRYVVNAAGLGAGTLSALAGDNSLKIKPRSGEYLLLKHGTGELVKQVLFQMPGPAGKGILVTPTYHGNLMIGPDAIEGESATRDTHIDRLKEIYRQALRSVPELPVQNFIRSFSGVRTVSSTDDFVLEASKKLPCWVQLAGIQSPGLTSSPALAQLARDLLADLGLVLVENPAFNPERPPILPDTPETKVWLKGPTLFAAVDKPMGEPDRIVCRCEQIREATLREALTRGLPVETVDAVKRRTRAGMGFCQGDFCRSRVAAYLEEQLKSGASECADSRTDVEAEGLSRVTRKDWLNRED